MYDCVKALIEKEKELAGLKGQQEPKHEESTAAAIVCSSDLKSIEDLIAFPIFPAGTKSLLSKCLTD
jgi:hypothetical protein